MSESARDTSRSTTVSVVIPAFNRARTIAECVTSVLRQTYDDLEVVIVDDGSTDDTPQVLEPLLRDARLRYVHQENAGAGAARNKGVAVSCGGLVAFLDSDDLWKPEKLSADVEFLSKHPAADAVFTDVEKQDGADLVPSLSRQFPWFSSLISGRDCVEGTMLSQRGMFLCLLQELPVKTSALTMRRAAFESIGGFDPSIVSGQDWELFLRFARTRRFGYIDRPLAVHRTSRDSLHVVSDVPGIRTMWRMLLAERRRLAGDEEAQRAASRGVSIRSKRVAWRHLARGERAAGIKAYMEGFRDSGDWGLLARALGNLLPEGVRRTLRCLRRRASAP